MDACWVLEWLLIYWPRPAYIVYIGPWKKQNKNEASCCPVWRSCQTSMAVTVYTYEWKKKKELAINRLLLHIRRGKKKKKGRESIATSPSKGLALMACTLYGMEMLDSLAAGVGTLEQLGANQSAITAEQMFLFLSFLLVLVSFYLFLAGISLSFLFFLLPL